jgi:hypothetical protein
MGPALPADVQTILQRSTAAATSPSKGWRGKSAGLPAASAVVLEAEARDPRTACDVVLQLLAFRPTAAPAAAEKLPSALRSMYFTLHFYSFGPTVTEPCLLVAGCDCSQDGHRFGEQQSDADKTFLLMPVKQVGIRCKSFPAMS